MSDQNIKSRDVAKLAGVSRSAVSRAFTEGASISPETKERVFHAARSLGYSPNAIARSLITSKSRIVGVVTAGLDNPTYATWLEAINVNLQKHGLATLLFIAPLLEDTDNSIEQLLTYQVDALILTAVPLSSTAVSQCRRANKPIILLNRYTEKDHVISVTGDNIRGGRDVARYLLKAGYKQIAGISGLDETSDGRDRMRGFIGELGAHGRVPTIEPGLFSIHGAATAARTLLTKEPRPDAIFCANDVMAAAAIDVARNEFGLRVPEDVAFVGYDNSSISRWPAYSMTTVDVDIPELARLAVEVVTQPISQERGSRRLKVAPRLVVRTTSRAC